MENLVEFSNIKPIEPTKYQSIYLKLRRILECIIIIVLSPVIIICVLIISVILIIDGKSNPFFVQDRIGINGSTFKMYKLRTLDNDKKITKFCQFIRNHRIDEIPQFLNIIIGDMSIIGPRPEPKMWYFGIIEQFPQFTYRNAIKPGLTCLSQIYVGYTFNIDLYKEKLIKDLEYIREISPKMDLFILYKTVAVLINKKGAM